MAENITDEDLEVTPGYKAPEKKSVQEIMSADADDESLVRYKKQLMGDAANFVGSGPPIVVEKLSILVKGRDDICLDLTGDLAKLKTTPIVLKEGCEYQLMVTFRLNVGMVSGLRLVTKIMRKGIKVDTLRYMLGSYAAKVEPHNFTGTSEDAPSGMISRGKYDCKSVFTDDDKNIILEWEWALEIKKHWPEEKEK